MHRDCCCASWCSILMPVSEAFEAKLLPKAKVRDAENSALLGVGAVAPSVDPEAESAGLVPTQEAAAKQAWQRRVAPRHRNSVKEFFRPTGSDQ